MKKKLIIGLSLVTVLFFFSGVFILKNLRTILSNHELVENHERILSKYDSMLFVTKEAQTKLYRHQAGYSRDIDGLVEDVLRLEDMLSDTEKEFKAYQGRAACNDCHSLQEKLESNGAMIKLVNKQLGKYQGKISLIITSKEKDYTRLNEKQATEEGERIIEIILNQRGASLRMNEGLEKYKLTSINRSIYSIIIALTASLMLSLIVIVLTVRSITGPVNVLVRGIGRVSTGDFDSKVNITSHDEIGYIADTFNDMIVNLKEVTLKKEELMSELREINIDLEERVRQATEELRMAHEKMLHTETLSIVGTFASGVAHEMATPLSSLISYVQMLKGKFQGRKGVEDLNIIEGELHRLRIILGGMLDFARVPKKEKLSTDINSIINELMSLLRYQKEYKNIMVKTDVDTGIPAISAVPGQLKQVFMNIIMNALQAMPDGGELTVSTSATGDNKKVIIRIEDTGYGISRDVIDRVFQPFYTNKKSGTGLGLSISYGIIKGHHGDITVESRVDKGTVFTITLPV